MRYLKAHCCREQETNIAHEPLTSFLAEQAAETTIQKATAGLPASIPELREADFLVTFFSILANAKRRQDLRNDL